MEALHQVMESFTGRPGLRLKFLIGHRALYSKKEQDEAIKLPAVLFSHLDKTSAREIQRVLEGRGFKVAVTRRRALNMWRHPQAAAALGGSVLLTAVMGVLTAANGGLPTVLMSGAGVTAGVAIYWASKLAGARGLFQLRPAGPPAAGADRLLSSARQASGALQAPEVRALFVEVSRELYRLTRRAEELARTHPAGSSEEALTRRLLTAAPAVGERLEAVARRLELLDAALEHGSDGDTMRALAILERRLAGDANPELELARQELEATLERRHQAEAERERLAATLCRALATVRDSYRRARTLVTLEEHEAAMVAAALEGLEAELK
jgi:hypothetical protein